MLQCVASEDAHIHWLEVRTDVVLRQHHSVAPSKVREHREVRIAPIEVGGWRKRREGCDHAVQRTEQILRRGKGLDQRVKFVMATIELISCLMLGEDAHLFPLRTTEAAGREAPSDMDK